MFVVMIVDEAGFGTSLSRAFSVLGRELGDVLVIFLIGIVGAVVLSFVPFVGGRLVSCLNVVIGLAFIYVYYANEKRLKSPPFPFFFTGMAPDSTLRFAR